MVYYPHNADTNVQIFTTLHGYYNAKSQASYKYTTTTNYGRKPDHSKQVQQIPIEYIINDVPKIDFTS